ncbi:MAG: GerMN domain-containing protein [Actinobacteria bacterium]|nr:MAG: GerMN domain-containing protein [Actinomycetota bacterium]
MTRRIALPLIAIALVVAACSVPRDANARVVTNPQNSTPVTVTTSNVDAPRTQAKVYFVRSSDKKLEGVMTSVKKPAMAYELLEALILDGPQERRLESKIPKTVSFEVRPSPEPNELIVILPNFDVSNVNRGTLILAFQQIVFTLTELPNVNSVQFSVNTRLYPVPLKNGDKPVGQGVGVRDYDQETIYTTTTTTLPPATTAPATTAPASSAPTSAPPGASAPTSAPAASSR